MKILYFTDSHDMGRNPGARIDDYHEAILEKFDEAYSVAIKEEVDAVVHGGDWFHYPKVANTIYNQHQRKLRKLRKKKIPVYVVPGNHDLYGYSLDTLDQTSLGSLANAGLVKLLTRKKSYEIMDFNHTVALHGREYSVDIDHDPTTDYDITPNAAADYNLLFSHGMLLDKPFHPDVRCTLTKDVVTQADYIFNGHYHPGWKMHTIGHTTFVNNGSTGRDEGSVDSIKRTPCYTIITIEWNDKTKQDVVTIEAHPYKCAKAGKDVFDRTQLVQKKEHVRYLESFEQTVQDALAYEAFDPKDIIKNTTGLSRPLLSEALRYIVDQEQRIQDGKLDGFIVKKKAIGIESVELENFQSHKKTKVTFDEKGLNAITGASDSGKSAIIRALRWVLYNEPKGVDFIRHGTSRSTVTVTFTDGSSITRSRTNSSAGEYIVRDASGNETEFKGFGNNIPIDIANTHQMPKVELSTGIEKPLNFSYQLDGHFLLSESPATRAATIGRLTGVHLVDGAVKEVSKEIRQLTIDTNGGEKRIAELDEQLAQYDDLAEERKKLDTLHGIIQATERIEQKIEHWYELLNEYEDHTVKTKDLKHELKSYSHVDHALLMIELTESKIKEIHKLNGFLEDIKTATAHKKRIEKDLEQYKNVDDALHKIDETFLLNQQIEQLEKLYNDVCKAEEEVYLIENEIKQYQALKHIDDLEKPEKLLKALRRMEELYAMYIKNDEDVERIEQELQDAVKHREEVQARIHELISQMGTCPTCHQSMDDHVALEMLDHV